MVTVGVASAVIAFHSLANIAAKAAPTGFLNQ